jgi:hypothetical protein
MVVAVTTLVRVPSVSGTDSENEAQDHMAGLFGAAGSTSIIGGSISHGSSRMRTCPADPWLHGHTVEVDWWAASSPPADSRQTAFSWGASGRRMTWPAGTDRRGVDGAVRLGGAPQGE